MEPKDWPRNLTVIGDRKSIKWHRTFKVEDISWRGSGSGKMETTVFVQQ